MAIIEKDRVSVYNSQGKKLEKSITKIEWDMEQASKGGYPHFMLKEIEELETEGKEALKEDQWRMEYHVMPPVGWLNDPNGLCQYQGEYYAFFQYSPFHPEGGLKVWGEYISKDLVHWEYAGVPLVADSPYDCHGAYFRAAHLPKTGCWNYSIPVLQILQT